MALDPWHGGRRQAHSTPASTHAEGHLRRKPNTRKSCNPRDCHGTILDHFTVGGSGLERYAGAELLTGVEKLAAH